jgi:hypothetical protein
MTTSSIRRSELVCVCRIAVALVVAFTMRCSAFAADVRTLAQAKPGTVLNVFLLAGQSNMAGADSIIADPPGFQTTEADRESLCTSAPVSEGKPSRAYQPWGPVQGHPSFNERYGEKRVHGPEVGFVRGIYARDWRNIAIIKVYGNFKGDSEIWPWNEGGELHKPWRIFVDERLAELKEKGYGYRVAGFVWHQGIDDGIYSKSPDKYGERLTALIGTLRKNYATDKTPFLLARSVNSPIARRLTGEGEHDPMAVVRKAQVAVGTSVPYCAWINVDDLPNVVQHHFTAESQLIIGSRFAEAFLKLSNAK